MSTATPPAIALAVLDMAGTTVEDGGLVLAAFDVAATAIGIPADGPERDHAWQYVIETMGQSKITVFRALTGDDEERAQLGNRAFEAAYDDLIGTGDIRPIEGAEKAIATLREAGVKVALTTGFSRATQHRLLDVLGWADVADLTLSPEEVGRGRPYPDLVLRAVIDLEIDDVGAVAVLGDTSSDIVSGLRAGARIVAGTLTGAHDRQQLDDAGATHVVDSVSDFTHLVLP
ncbi:phosphonatase-like hydrolase [Williamsia herbipolensis]|uniref:Phosphonatase-like hydrolase n=1 Tax=Williamsia herbipolensis TaxID=1603258 RepID=A0AAU4K5Y4_9NOCA|nr:phosphonatase-like hydrolase [Williamsia herbipolensis]